jgi:hypothetical protein
MTAATANKIFDVDYTTNAPGVTLNKFKDADALQAYLNTAGDGTPFFINEIAEKPVVAIGAGAFDESDDTVARLPGGLDIKLPATIKDVGAGAFKITSGATINLLIPETVLTVLAENDPAILYEISQSESVAIKKITAGSEESEAVYPEPAYRIELASMTNGTVTGSPKSAAVGETITLTPVPAPGYKYTEDTLSVTQKGDGETAVGLTLVAGDTRTFSMPDYDVTVSAEFEELPPGQYSVTINNLTHGNIIPIPTFGPAETEITLTVTPEAGYRLKAGSLKYIPGDVSINEETLKFSLPAFNVTVIAEFEPVTYTVTIDSLSNGGIRANPTSGVKDTVITLTVTPASGYRLNGTPTVTKTGESETVSVTGTSPYTFSMPAYDVTVSAEFEGIPAGGIIPINSAADMEKIGVAPACPIDGKYVLANDITVSNWTPIGSGNTPFSGVFDGAGHKITMTGTPAPVVIAAPADWADFIGSRKLHAAGLFGITGGAEIKNLNVEWDGGALSLAADSDLLFAGVVAGWAKNTDFTRVMVTGGTFSVTAPFPSVGGMAGLAEGSRPISQCGSTVNVNVTAQIGGFGEFVGGLVGNNEAPITESFASGSVTTAGCEQIGGLVGEHNEGAITDCYAEGQVNVSSTLSYGSDCITLKGTKDYESELPQNGNSTGDYWNVKDMQIEGNNRAGWAVWNGSAWEKHESTTYGAAGLIGRNQGGSITKSYARGNVIVNTSGAVVWHIGGIAGETQRQPKISYCAALNASLSLTGAGVVSYINRVAPPFGGGELSGNIANSAMSGGSFTSNANGLDGADCAAKPSQSDFTTLGWDFSTIWKMGGDDYPVLQWQD